LLCDHSSLNFVFRVLVETRCVGQIPRPQLAGNKPRFVAYICTSEGWSISDPNNHLHKILVYINETMTVFYEGLSKTLVYSSFNEECFLKDCIMLKVKKHISEKRTKPYSVPATESHQFSSEKSTIQ
jgi:hypothetical protein